MTYDTDKILAALQNLPININKDFYEEMNGELTYLLGENLFGEPYIYEHGASKLTIIPKEKNFVIKIPYTGAWYEDEDGDGDGFVEEYSEAYRDNNIISWNYCELEACRYEIAEEYGFEKYFAKTVYIGDINGFPIYVQEKCETLSNSFSSKNHSAEEKKKIRDLCGDPYIDLNWLVDFKECYGESELKKFISFIENNDWDDDLRTDNIGYLNNRPILIDYSGFYE